MDLTTRADAPTERVGKGHAFAWLVWTLACTGMLVVFALRVKVSAQSPLPQEDQGFVAVQIVALILAAWLAPLLLSDLHRVVLASSTLVPLLLIAQFLRGLPALAALPAIAATVAWLFALYWAVDWRFMSRLLAIASVLGPVLWYLSQEFAPTPFHLGHPLTAMSPPLGAAATSSPESAIWPMFWPVVVLGIARLTVRVAHARRRPMPASTAQIEE